MFSVSTGKTSSVPEAIQGYEKQVFSMSRIPQNQRLKCRVPVLKCVC